MSAVPAVALSHTQTHKTYEWMIQNNTTVKVSSPYCIYEVWQCSTSCSHLNSCTYSCRVITRRLQLMSEKEEVLITGGEEEISSEELNKLTNPVWDPVTPSSSTLNLDHSTTITHPSHGRESTQPWIIPVGRCKHQEFHWGPWLVCRHCLYCPLVGCCVACMREWSQMALSFNSWFFPF